MIQNAWHNAWDDVIKIPWSGRSNKPRNNGITMVMDKGLGINETTELISVAGNYIDYLKLAFGTPALYDGHLLREKISLVRKHHIHIYPGGTFLEIAIMQSQTDEFLDRAWELGFSAIEVSDGTISVSRELRQKIIKGAVERGFRVFSEVGKKDPFAPFNVDEISRQINSDLEDGAYMVIIEARESGKSIGIFNEKGEINKEDYKNLLSKIVNPELIMWEAPLKGQQQELILDLGLNVNVGNITPGDVLALEALRVGLRGDTLKKLCEINRLGCLR